MAAIEIDTMTTGTVRPGNHSGTSRSTLMKVIASPAPTSTRATTAVGTLSARASTSCPTAMVTAPATIIFREPNRSSSTPTGTWRPA